MRLRRGRKGRPDLPEVAPKMTNLEIWRAVTTAWAEGDTEALARFVDPELTIVEPDCLPYRGTFTGPEGYADLYRQITACWTDLEIERGAMIGGGEDEPLVIEYFTSATARATGQRIEREPNLSIWKFREGKVVSMTPFNFDTVVLCAALASD